MAEAPTLIADTSFLGDVLCAEPLARAVAARHPGPVDFLTSAGGAQMLAGHPELRNVLVFDKRGAHKGIRGLLRFAKELRANGYARVYCTHRSWRTAFLLWRARIADRVGFDNASAAWLYHRRVNYRKDLHEIERNLEMVGGGAWQRPRMFPKEAEAERAHELAPGRNFVCIAPGSIWGTKRWPGERFIELVHQLSADGVRCVLLGGPDDAGLTSVIAANADGEPVVDLAGATNLRESYAVLQRAAALVTNDSAPMHLGVAAGIPVIAIYCSTVPSFGFAPRGEDDEVLEISGLDCRPCGIHGHPVCPEKHFRCGWDIEAASVLERVRKRLPAG